jgi:hypothetical protein
MSLFGNLTSDGLEDSQDRLGGSQVFESNIYTGPIKVAYAGQAPSGARNVTLIMDLGGNEYRETVYITNKKGENYFLNKEDKSKKVPLPGFTTIDDICLVTTGKPLAEQESEDKMVKVYDPDLKKEVPKSVPVITALLGQIVSLAISKNLENKSEKDNNGTYVPIVETRLTNNIEKVFHTETQMSVAEARNGLEKGLFWNAWIERNKGKDRDKRTIKDGIAGHAGKPGGSSSSRGAAGPPQASNAGQTPRKSIFGAKTA